MTEGIKNYNLKSLISFLGLFLLGIIVLIIRNPDPFLNQIVYTEDGQWIGLALTKGWLYTLFNAKEGYFVWGNIGLLWAAVTSSKLFCGTPLICLPQSIAIFSFTFYASLATLVFFAMRPVASISARFLLYCLILLLPMGDSSNEILGRISNIGYLCVLVTVLLTYQRESSIGASRFLIDAILIALAGTNPVVVPLLVMYLVWRIYSAPEKKSEYLQNQFLGFGLLAVGALIAIKMHIAPHSSITGVLQPQNLIEVGIARSILYPLLFPFYTNLSNVVTVVIFGFWVLFVGSAFGQSSKSARTFIAFNLVALFTFAFFTIVMRQSLTEQLGHYKVTFPDRYFMGLNAIVVVITVTCLSELAKYTNIYSKRLAVAMTSLLVLLYMGNALWIFETDESRFKIIQGLDFADQICLLSSELVESGSRDHVVLVPTFMDTLEMTVPVPLLIETAGKLDCQISIEKVTQSPLNINDKKWLRGISRNWPGFVMFNSAVSQNMLQPGKNVKFVDGSVRRVTRQEQNGQILNIFLEGQPLDGALVGYPNKFEVEK